MESDAGLVQEIPSARLTDTILLNGAAQPPRMIAQPQAARCLTGRPQEKAPVSLPNAIAIAMRFGHLLDFPEHPHKGRTQADDDAQKQQRQARGCEHVDHP